MASKLREMVDNFSSLPEEKKDDALKEIQREAYRIESMRYLLDDIRYASLEAIGKEQQCLLRKTWWRLPKGMKIVTINL